MKTLHSSNQILKANVPFVSQIKRFYILQGIIIKIR